MNDVSVAVDAHNQLGEGVLWCERTARLWWTDIRRSVLWCHEPASGATSSRAVPERLCSFALTPDDDVLLLGLSSRLAFFHVRSGALKTICEVEPELATTRLNDGRCDRQGRFVFGTMNEDNRREKIGSFYRLGTDLRLEKLPLGGVAIANSICFSPDGSRMYYTDSMEKTIRCCNYGPGCGPGSEEFANKRVFTVLDAGPGAADGSTVDSEGRLWNAQWGGSRVVCYTPEGRVHHVIHLPVSQPTCVCFGGEELRQLYITTAHDELSAEVLARQPAAGSLFQAMPGGLASKARGLAESRFLGKLL
jgi:L-arabinonolactonase